MWRSSKELPHFNTPSIRDKWHRWERRSTSKKDTSAVLLQPRVDERWWSEMRWDAIAICEMSKTSWQTGKLRVKDDLVNRTIQSTNNSFCCNGWISSDFTEIYQEVIKLARKYCQASFLATSWSRGEFGKEISWKQIWKGWTHQKFVLEELKRLITYKGDEFIFPIQQNCQEETANSENPLQGGNRPQRVKIPERTSRWIGRASTGRINRWRWSPCALLVDPRCFHLSSSQWTSSSTLRAAGRNIPCSTEVHCCKKKSGLTIAGIQTLVRFVARIHEVHSIERKASKKDICGPGGDWQKFKRLPDQITCGQKDGRKLVLPLRIKKTGMGTRETKARQCSKTERNLLCRSWTRRILRNSQNMRENGKTSGTSHALKKISKRHHKSVCAKSEIASDKKSKTVIECIVASHESTRQGVESFQPRNHEDNIAGKRFTSMSHYNLAHKSIPLPKVMKIPDAKAALDKEWKELEKCSSMEIGESQEQEGGYSGSTKRQKESPLSNIDGHMSPQECGVGTKIINVQRQSRAPWWHCKKTNSGVYAVFTEQGSSASQMTAAKVMDVIARLPDWDGQAADAVSACTQLILEDAPRLLENAQGRMSRRMDTSSTT